MVRGISGGGWLLRLDLVGFLVVCEWRGSGVPWVWVSVVGVSGLGVRCGVGGCVIENVGG